MDIRLNPVYYNLNDIDPSPAIQHSVVFDCSGLETL